MAADTKSLKRRIKSVSSTLHLTKAMGLVASSKIRRATDYMLNGQAYASAAESIIDILAICPECRNNPYMKQRSVGNELIVVIAGDRGLAGGYNSNVFRLAEKYQNAEIIPIGKRACERFGRKIILTENFGYRDAAAMSKKLCSEFTEEKYSRIGIISTKYVSAMVQEAQINWILPIVSKNTDPRKQSIIFEPDPTFVFNAAVAEYTASVLFSALKESFACEIAARRVAMDAAEKNAKEMIEDLQLSYNRARQNAITQEITEIVAGSGS